MKHVPCRPLLELDAAVLAPEVYSVTGLMGDQAATHPVPSEMADDAGERGVSADRNRQVLQRLHERGPHCGHCGKGNAGRFEPAPSGRWWFVIHSLDGTRCERLGDAVPQHTRLCGRLVASK